MKRLSRKNTVRIVLPLALAMIAVALWVAWYITPLAEQELRCSDARIIVQTRYVVMNGDKELFAFTSAKGDSLLNGVGTLQQKSIISTDTLDAEWVRRWKYLPYNGGTLAVEAYDASSVCMLKPDSVMALLQRENRNINAYLSYAADQKKDIDYYIRTHMVTDDGFDIVARYDKTLSENVDSVTKALNIITAVIRDSASMKKISIRLDRKYYLFEGQRTYPCTVIGDVQADKVGDKRSFMTLVKCTEVKPDNEVYHRLPSSQQAHLLLKKRLLARPVVPTAAIDSLGNYVGERDSVARPHGYGRFLAYDGRFYEGEWSAGKRTGIGFSMNPGQRLRLGEWKEDKFLGERLTYTPERIYGIDISRHQHEKGKKRYTINWKALRITSLGTLSKKKIKGDVSYPVSFVFIKATEGVTIVNKYLDNDYAFAHKYGYKVGAYHFFSVKTPGKSQAINFLKNSKYRQGDLPPVLDIEPTDAQIKNAGGIEVIFKNVREWLNTVEGQYKVKPILYISQMFINKYFVKAPDLMKKYDVWIARYGEYKPDVNMVFWQLSPDGRVSGIHGEVDINVLNGFDL